MRYSEAKRKTKEYKGSPSPGTRPQNIYKINYALWMDLPNYNRN